MSHQIKLHYALSTEHPKLLHVAQHSSSGAPCDCPPGYVCIGPLTIIGHEPPLLVGIGIGLVVGLVVGFIVGRLAAKKG